MGVGVVLLNLRRIALGAGAGAVVATVQPVHVRAIPDAEDEHHAFAQGLAHLGQAAIGIGRGAGLGGDRVKPRISRGVGDDFPILDVLSTNLVESSAGGAVIGEELGCHGKRPVGVDGHARAIEVVLSLGVGVETTARAVAGIGLASMRSEDSCFGIGFPQIHLITAVGLIVDIQSAVAPGRRRALRIAVS